MKRCTMCAGSGLVYLDVGPDGQPVEDLRECPRCGGTGEEEANTWPDLDYTEPPYYDPNDRII